MAYRLYIIGIFLFPGLVHGLISCQQPEKPNLVRVSVDPETGNDIVYWEPSPSPGVDYYIIGRAVRPNPLEPYALIQVGSAPHPETSFVVQSTTSAVESVGYTVWAVDQLSADSLLFSLYDEPDSTIFARAVFDSCQGTISIDWSDYNSWRGAIRQYTVYQRLDNGLYMVLATLPEGTDQYTLYNVQENITYSLFIEASHEDNIRLSRSNRIDLITDMSLVPDAIYADYATLGAFNSVDLSFTVDPGSEMQTYKLLRSGSPDGVFDTIATLHTTDKIIYCNDDIPFTSGLFYYKLVAFNNCGRPVITSNLASNILLGGTIINMQISLDWNEYLNWTGGVDHYQVTRITVSQGSVSDSVSVGTDTFFRDDYTNRINYDDPQSARVCYRITAYESGGTAVNQNISHSNLLCFSLDPDVRMPNAFIPNSNDGINNLFGPVFSFAPERYEMTVFNRSGLKIWEGSGPWDGTVNGKYVSEGVFLYHLNLFNFDGTSREITGQVTVVYQ